jgi:XTP/dITP diphosphohydrolase
VCVIAYFDGSEKKFFEGYCEGRINDSKRGTGGFGYDPLFIPDGYDKTYAELDPETKNSISHRGRALRKLTEYLKTEMLP